MRTKSATSRPSPCPAPFKCRSPGQQVHPSEPGVHACGGHVHGSLLSLSSSWDWPLPGGGVSSARPRTPPLALASAGMCAGPGAGAGVGPGAGPASTRSLETLRRTKARSAAPSRPSPPGRPGYPLPQVRGLGQAEGPRHSAPVPPTPSPSGPRTRSARRNTLPRPLQPPWQVGVCVQPRGRPRTSVGPSVHLELAFARECVPAPKGPPVPPPPSRVPEDLAWLRSPPGRKVPLGKGHPSL